MTPVPDVTLKGASPRPCQSDRNSEGPLPTSPQWAGYTVDLTTPVVLPVPVERGQ